MTHGLRQIIHDPALFKECKLSYCELPQLPERGRFLADLNESLLLFLSEIALQRMMSGISSELCVLVVIQKLLISG